MPASFFARTRKAWGAGASAAGAVAGTLMATGQDPQPWQIGAVVGAFVVAFGVTWAAPNAE